MRGKSLVLVVFSLLQSIHIFGEGLAWRDIPFAQDDLNIGMDSYPSVFYEKNDIPDLWEKFLNRVYEKNSKDIFSVNNREFGWRKEDFSQGGVVVSRLRCLRGMSCFLVSPGDFVVLVVYREDSMKLTDFSLVYASVMDWEGDIHHRKAERKFRLNSEFGKGGGWVYPPSELDNDFIKTGIFCSYISDQLQGGTLSYKRRINSLGRIEYKVIDNWRDCRAPW